jgi:hypothetical protein
MSIQGPSTRYDTNAPTFSTIPSASAVTPSAVPPKSESTIGIAANVSPWAKLLSKLQHLQQTNPAAFPGVVSQMADAVKTAADKSTGDEKQSLVRVGSQLAELAKTGDLPAFKAPKHHHHTHPRPASGGTMSLLQGLIEQIDHVLGPGATPAPFSSPPG